MNATPQSLRVLVVAADAATRQTLCETLAARGHAATPCSSTEAAVVHFRGGGQQWLLLELGKATEELSFCRWLRSQPGGDRIFVLAVVRNDPAAELPEIFAAGVDDLLVLSSRPEESAVRLAVAEQRVQKISAKQRAEELHETVLRTAKDGFWVIDLAGKILEVNEAYCRLSGYSQAELLTMHVADLRANEKSSSTTRYVKRLVAMGEDRFETRHRAKDGSIIELEVADKYMADGGGRIFSFLRDITAQKKAETARRETEARFQAVVESLSEGLLITDLEDVVLHVNSRMLELTGFSRAELMGARAYELLTRREEWPLALKRDQQRAQGRSEAYETLTLCRNGGSFWAQVHASPLRGLDGQIIGTVGAVTDITDRKLAETALRESSELYRAMFETNQAVKLLVDPASGQIVDANSAASRFYGYDLATLKRMEIFRINPAPPEQVRELLLRAAERQSHYFEVAHRLASGEVREVEVHTGPLEVNGRKLLFSIVNDITERRRAEKSLELRVQLERLIAEISTHFINLAAEEIDAGIHHALQQLAEFQQVDRGYVFRYSPDGSQSSNTHEWCAPDVTSRRAAFQNLPLSDFPWFTSHIPGMEPLQVTRVSDLPAEAAAERFLLETGGIKSCLLIPLIYGKAPVGCFGFDAIHAERRWPKEEVTLLRFVGEIFVNALERKKSAAEIESLAAFPRYNPNMVIEFTPEGKLAYFNAAARAMAHDLGKGNMRDILPPGTPQIVHECLTTNRPRLQLNTNFGPRTLAWSFFPVPAIPAVHCYAVEITERLNIEAQLRQAQKMESIGQLAAGLAHDFNNVLTVITGHAGLLLNDKQLRPEQTESIRQMADATERASNLTRQLLTFSRKQVIQPRTLELHEVIAQLTKMLARILGEDIALEFNYASPLPPIHADQGMMEQILLNLAVNARDAMPKGGRLTITATAQTIDEAYVAQNPLARPGQFVRLCVEDTGCGIARENLPRLFEPFFTTKDVGKGTGLGLATVYGIVRQHEGWIEVASELGRGATFKIFLPVATRLVRPQPPARSTATVRGGNERVLVVEDEPALCSLVRQILGRFGYQVEVAGSGVAALKLWDQLEGRVDLLLTDMVMPEGISGRELAEHLASKKPSLKIIYSSGYSAEMAGQDLTLREGFNFLQKPYDPMKLALAVRESLDR